MTEFEQTHRWPGVSLRAMRRRDNRGLNAAATAVGYSVADYVYAGLLVLVGAALQGYANGTADALTVGIVFLFAGSAIVRLVFPGKQPEQRAFLLTYGICVFVGGLAQCYSLVALGELQGTVDAAKSYLPAISQSPPFATMADYNPHGAPLALFAWQQVYKLTWLLGLKFGPYTAVMFNALVMSLAAGITTATARELFGNDTWRLRRVGILFAFCGLFILFGAVWLRDCFTTFFNALVLWGLVRWLVRPVMTNLLFALAATGIGICAMLYLREASIVMFGFFWFLAFLFWLQRERMNPARLIAVWLVLCASMIAVPYILGFLSTSTANQSRYIEGYSAQSEERMEVDSLAMQMIVRQPLPIRLVVGSGFLMVFPMPLWAYLKSDITDYHLIKTWHGFYQVLIMPLVFAGFLAVFCMFQRDRKRAVPLVFLAAYLLMNLLAVVATSMEQRHLAQFMPAFIIVAALPGTRQNGTRRGVWHVAIAWFALVALLHLAWIVLKAIQ